MNPSRLFILRPVATSLSMVAILVVGIGASAIGASATQLDAHSRASRGFTSTSDDIAHTIGAELQEIVGICRRR